MGGTHSLHHVGERLKPQNDPKWQSRHRLHRTLSGLLGRDEFLAPGFFLFLVVLSLESESNRDLKPINLSLSEEGGDSLRAEEGIAEQWRPQSCILAVRPRHRLNPHSKKKKERYKEN